MIWCITEYINGCVNFVYILINFVDGVIVGYVLLDAVLGASPLHCLLYLPIRHVLQICELVIIGSCIHIVYRLVWS